VLDGVEKGLYESISSFPIFSNDSQHVALYAKEGNKSFMVVDGEEGIRYEKIICEITPTEDNGFEAVALREKNFYKINWKPQVKNP